MKQFIVLVFISLNLTLLAQDYGDFPKLSKDKLLRDLELLYQGLDSYHSGMYWYSTKDSVYSAFESAKLKINKDLNVLEYHKIIAPLIALSREDHTDLSLPKIVLEKIKSEAYFLPMTIVFLGEELYCVKNGSNKNAKIEGKRILSINDETPKQIVQKIGNLFASDGYIKRVKFSDLRRFSFSRNYYYYYGNVPTFEIEFEDDTIEFQSLKLSEISKNISNRYRIKNSKRLNKESLEFKMINDKIAYLGLHDFDNSKIRENTTNNNFKKFLKRSFESISKNKIKTLIIDLSENGGGSEGNENLVFSYIGDNYQKYKKVRAKTQCTILDNGVDNPIKLKTFGFFERIFVNKKMSDGSYERKKNIGFGLMAYKKEPKFKFKGELYVIISPITYSGGSELSNMIYSNNLATFVGEETGGGYYGNTSGYSKKLTLPNSEIVIKIPALQFIMNVKELIPFGRGVIPHFEVIPTFEQYINNENSPLNYILNSRKTNAD